MRTVYYFFKRNFTFIVHLFFTTVICMAVHLLNQKYANYQFIGNFIITIAFGFCIYRILFQKQYKDSVLKICCLFVISACVNEIYSFSNLKNIFPWLKNIHRNWFWIIFLTIIAAFLILKKVILTIGKSFKYKEQTKLPIAQEAESVPNTSSSVQSHEKEQKEPHEQKITSRTNHPLDKEPFRYLRLTGIVFLSIFFTSIPAFLLYIFNKYKLDAQELEFDKVVFFFMSYGFAFLLILCAVIFVFITLLHAIKHIFHLIASFSSEKESTDNEGTSIPLYAISTTIVLVIMFISWKISSFNINDLTETLVAGDYLALPLAMIILITLFFLLVNLVHAILFALSKNDIARWKKLNEETEATDKIVEIIRIIISIILDTIMSICSFILFIPDFFSSLVKMVLPNRRSFSKSKFTAKEENRVSINSDVLNEEGIEIVQIAAFAFAILSWLATAQGMHQYVFQDYNWQALLISFGIQSILFVFNLRLPYFFHKIGKKTSNRKKRKYYWGKRKGQEKSTYKWTTFQKLIAVFYAALLFSSSFFSFVYITNLVYRDTQYIDTHTVLTQNYRMYLQEIDKYCNEFSKITQLSISRKVSELQEMIPRSNGTHQTKEELEEALIDAEREYTEKIAEETAVQQTFDAASQIYMTPMSERWRNASTYEEEREEYEKQLEYLRDAKKATALANAARSKAEQALNNYKPTADIVVHELLSESLKTNNGHGENLDIQVNNLKELLLKSDGNIMDTSEFADIVNKTQELSIAVGNYQTINQIREKEGSNNDISDLQNGLLSEDITIPVPSSDNFVQDKLAWEMLWKQRFSLLGELILSTPDISEATITDLTDVGTVVNTTILTQFDAEKKANEISRISRNYLENINAIERAIILFLHSDFPALARFSAVFALFLDLASLSAGLFIYLISKPNSEK